MAAADDDEETKKRLADTNLENYGGEEHRAKQKAIADKQAEWDGAGDEVGVQVWRINKFKVDHVDPEDYGSFYSGDSYIVLNTYLEDGGEEKLHNVHFWLGESTSQDEAGAAAIKTVELDDKLGDLPVQFREVQGHETKTFLSIFDSVSILEGGHDSGFRHVTPEEYETRLIHVSGRSKKKMKAREVPLNVENLNNKDAFLLDAGTELFQFHPPGASIWEKQACLGKQIEIETARNGKVKKKYFIEWSDGPAEPGDEEKFWSYFGGKPEELPENSQYQLKKKEEENSFKNHTNKMFHVTNETGEMVIEEVQSGVLNRDTLEQENDDALIIDVGRIIFVWIGATANRDEAKTAMLSAQQYMSESSRPMWTPVERVFAGREPAHFWKAFGCERCPKDIC